MVVHLSWDETQVTLARPTETHIVGMASSPGWSHPHTVLSPSALLLPFKWSQFFPTSRPSHMLFPLSGMLFLALNLVDSCFSLRSQLKYYISRGDSFDHFFPFTPHCRVSLLIYSHATLLFSFLANILIWSDISFCMMICLIAAFSTGLYTPWEQDVSILFTNVAPNLAHHLSHSNVDTYFWGSLS